MIRVHRYPAFAGMTAAANLFPREGSPHDKKGLSRRSSGDHARPPGRAHEMGAKLIRSAHSPIVREAQDCSAALLDRRGNVVAQSELIALQLGSITHTFRPCLELYDLDEIEPDDFFINNDPFHGGQHLPDIFIFSPVFFEDELVGFSATVVHHIDLGGGAPGLNPKAGDIHQEGLVFPPTNTA